jgi:hypothetical protein
MKSFSLNINDIRGQGYDNGSNMKGKHQGYKSDCLILIQEHYICHVLAKVLILLCDMSNSCGKVVSFSWDYSTHICVIRWFNQNVEFLLNMFPFLF